MIKVSAPGKIHLLGEHTVVYGKPALLATVDLRIAVILRPLSSVIARSETTKQSSTKNNKIAALIARNDIEPIVKKHLKIKTIPPYHLEISSQLPIGCGLGSSAALSAAYIAALLTFLGIKWDKSTVNNLTYEAEKAFHGNPSGGDNSTVVFGGSILYLKGKPIQTLPFSIPPKLAKNFILINTGIPKETTKEMVEIVNSKFKSQKSKVRKIFDDQEKLVKELLPTLQEGNGKELIRIIRAGEKNLESIGVVSSYVKTIIRKVENSGGAAKICGAGGKTKATGFLLCYHPSSRIIKKIAKFYKLDYIKTKLGVEGLKLDPT